MAKSSPASGAKKAPSKATKSPASKKRAVKQPAPASKAPAKRKAAVKRQPAPTAATRAAPAKKTVAKAAKAHAAPDGKKASNSTAKAPNSRPAKSPFDAKFLERQHQALLTERATYTRQAFNLQAEADSLVADFEPGDVQFDEESGEGDTLNIERERDLALSAQARAQVEEIDHALAKFELGTYGICEVSGEPVPEERLEAIPWARQRVQYKTGGLGRR